MPYRYPPEFRRRVLDLLAVGRSVASLSADLGVSDQTIHNWRRLVFFRALQYSTDSCPCK